MKPSRTRSAIAGYVVMALTIGVGVALFMFADIQLALARIDPGNSATWPNMDPQVRYVLVPILAPVVAVAAVVVDLLLGLVYRRRIVRLTHWVLLGVAYSLVMSLFPIRYLGVDGRIALLVCPSIAFACVILVRWRYGVPPQSVAV
jgi:hypothetical protein